MVKRLVTHHCLDPLPSTTTSSPKNCPSTPLQHPALITMLSKGLPEPALVHGPSDWSVAMPYCWLNILAVHCGNKE